MGHAVALVNWYHIICLNRYVFTVVYFMLYYSLTVAPPVTTVWTYPIHVHRCVFVLLNLVFWDIFTNFVYEWACLLLLSRLDAFWQVSQSTVNSVCYQSSYSYTCCISSFFISCFHHTSLSFYSHPKKVSQVSMECTAPQDWTCFTYTVPQPVVNVDIIVPIMTFVLYVCQRMVCTVMYASRQ